MNKKLGTIALLTLLASSPLTAMVSANGSTTVEKQGNVSSSTEKTPSNTAWDEELEEIEEENTDEEITEEKAEEKVTLEATIEKVTSKESADWEEVTTVIKTVIDPSQIASVKDKKAKLQFNLCGYNTDEEKCVAQTDLWDFSKAYLSSVTVKTQADGTDLPIQVSVMNESWELTRLSSNSGLYTPWKDGEGESGYGFYNMIVDMGNSDTIHEPVEVTITLVGDHTNYGQTVSSKTLGVGRLAIIESVKNIINIPVMLKEPEVPVEEPVEEPETPAETPVEKPVEVVEAKTGIDSPLTVLWGLVLLVAGAVAVRKYMN